jgi:7-cyano-7-deazaguanine synthase in queuosine biosynthesis
MSMPQPSRHTIVINGAPVPADFKAWDPNPPITVSWDGSTTGRSFAVQSRNWNLADEFDGHARDLIDIASGVFAADRRTSRGGSRDVHRDKWQRDLALCLPVSDPAFWSAPAVKTALSTALHFGTGDTWQFAFSQQGEHAGQRVLLKRDCTELQDPDSVLLLSGGIDSLCAVIQALDAGRRPVLVSQSAADHVFPQQEKLIEEIQRRYPGWRIPWLAFDIHGKDGDPISNSLRSRGFLFAALGMATAGKLGLGDVALADNGYVSINPAISAQLVGSLASRGTHPTFLALLNRLAAMIFAPVTVTNPLATQTRTDCLRRLDANGHGDLIALTRSCGKHRGRSTAVPHCGGCSQCVDRRFAVVASGLEAYDPADRYGIEIFAGAIPEGEPRTIATSFVEFARRTQASTDDALVLEHPELLDCVTPGSQDPKRDMERAIDVLRLHADDVIGAFGRMVSKHARDIASGTVHPKSLLGLMHPATIAPPPATAVAVPDNSERHTGDRDTESKNAMHLHHKVWHITFQGEKATVPAPRGMLQIALLLKHESQPLDVIALSRCEARTFGAAATWQGMRVSGASIIDERLARLELPELRRQRRQLQSDIETDRANGRDELVVQKTEALQVFEQYIKARTGKGGKPRAEGGEIELARKSVSKNVRRAYHAIDLVLPVLRAHLEAFVDLGVPPSYEPEHPMGWDVQH